MTTISLLQLVCGLGMICGVVVTTLGYALYIHAINDSQKFASRMITLLGGLMLVGMTLGWIVEVF